MSRHNALLAGTALSAIAGPATSPDDADKTPAELVKNLQKTWQEFTAKNDERLKQIEKRGEDAVTRAEVEKLNAELTRLADVADNTMKQIGRASIGATANDNARSLQAAADRFHVVARGQRLGFQQHADVEAYVSYRQAFAEAVRNGLNADMLPTDIRAALSIGSDRDGGYFVPTEESNALEQRVHDTSPMRQIANVMTIGTSAWEAPYKTSKGTSGGWVGERAARSTTGTGTTGVQRIEVHEQYAYPEVTQTMLDDASMAVEAYLTMDTEEEMVRTENTAFVSGDGRMKPRGFLSYKDTAVTTKDASRSWGLLQYRTSGAAGGFPAVSGVPGSSNPDALIDIIAKDLHPTYRAGANWTMNRSAEAEIRKLKDGDGRYLVGLGSIEGSLQFNLFGYPIVNLEDMPDMASDSFSVAFGNFRRGYYIIDRAGFRVLRDPYTNKPYVGFYITKRTGGDVRNFDAIKLLKMAV